MTETTVKHVEGTSNPLQATILAHPDGRGKYAASVSYNDRTVALSIRHVERPWLPMVLFGRVIHTKLVHIGGEAVREISLINDAHGLAFTILNAGADVERNTLLGAEWPALLREAVRADVDSAVHGRRGGLAVHLRGKTATLAGLFMVYAIFSSLSGAKQAPVVAPGAAVPLAGMTTPQAAAAPLLNPGESAGMSSAAIAQAAADEQTSLLPIKKALTQASFITLRAPGAGGKTLVIWSDPLCPNCRDFEQKVLAALPATLGVTVIPVSFKHGSRPLVSYAACASTAADRAARWKNLLSEQPTGLDVTQQCETGPAIADGNSSLFARAGLRSTPTLMKPDGEVFQGDQHSAEDVASWIAK